MPLILIAQITVSILLISVIMIQSKGTGLGSGFSGEGKSYHSKRGLEKTLFKSTIALSVIFLFISLLALV